MKQVLKFYKVRRKSNGLFSCGGQNNKFNMVGKTWNQIGHVKNYLRGLIPHHVSYRPLSTKEKQQHMEVLQDLEVIEFVFEMSPSGENVVPMNYESALSGGSF
jgi:hypothetical protein